MPEALVQAAATALSLGTAVVVVGVANSGVTLARVERPGDLVGGRTLLALGLLGALSILPVVVKKLPTPSAHG